MDSRREGHARKGTRDNLDARVRCEEAESNRGLTGLRIRKIFFLFVYDNTNTRNRVHHSSSQSVIVLNCPPYPFFSLCRKIFDLKLKNYL